MRRAPLPPILTFEVLGGDRSLHLSASLLVILPPNPPKLTRLIKSGFTNNDTDRKYTTQTHLPPRSFSWSRPSALDESYYVDSGADVDLEAQVPDIEGATYLGCFEDKRMERTMKIAYINNDDMTNEVKD